MGDHSGWNQPRGAQPNGLRPGVVSSVTRVLDAERWAVAERRTAEIIARIQPSEPSEERRKAVTGYVQQLIANCFPCQVFTFGSVPLKTYLPDGDIDLSAFSDDLQLRDTWANKVRQVLENEEKRENAEFHVKEVQYIQAEVKIIKCLVENIVVDISFNQLGGLCTLCFLDEIDHLIDRNHLFKRSIILIKAWCYYESRILGAHHGLISTYALETLVLYIFHVFNNSFSGPLEVLYRFMEFFSNFDWENFCLSLWGPVPITSLPDTTADSPLKDSAELLPTMLFLKACRDYAVSPATQENQGPPFVPKHFNIIDPLRINNNLGRSVSRGNFYRIRSALGFGAERLAGLNDCPEDLIIAEVDNFFVNTWRRHGARNRPDEPVLGMGALKLQVLDNNEEMKNKKNLPNTKSRTENVQLHANNECSGDEQMSFGRVSTQPSFPTKNSTHNMLVPSPQCQKVAAYQTSYEASEQPERSTDFSEKMAAQRFQKTSKPHSFARTHSSPDLSGSSSKFFSGGQRNKKPEGENQFKNERLALHGCGRNLNAEVTVDYVAVTSEDASSISHSLSERNLGADIAHSNGFIHGYQGSSRFPSLGGRLASASMGVDLHQKMCQDEQDMINIMALSNLHNFNERVQQPIDVSSCMRLPGSPVLLPNPYSQRPIGGIIPGNVPLLHPPSGSKLQFPQGLVSFNYFHNAGHQPNHEDKFEPKNDGFVVAEIEQNNNPQGYLWGQDAGTTSGFLPHKRVANSPKLYPDGKILLSLGEDSVSQLDDSNGPSIRNQDKFVRENTRLTWDVDNGAPGFPCTNELDTSSTERSAYIRCAPVATGSSSRSENVSESWDSTSTRSSKSGAGKNPGKPISSGGLTSSYNKTSSVWQYEDSSPDQFSMITDDEDRECVKLSARRTEITEPSILSPSLVTAHMQGHQVSGYSPVMMNGTDSGLTIPPVVYCNDFQRSVDANSRMLPLTFIATGPPVPYLIYPRKPTDFDDAENQLNALDSGNINSSHRSVDLDERLSCADDVVSSNSMDNSSEQHGQHTPDILNSDFASHWQNLQFGRFCHAQPQKPLVQASPMVVPQMHLQGNTPWSGPERPITANPIAYPLVMNYEQRLIPTIPLQAGPRKPSGVYQSYREEVPRTRVGTGTFLPNHVPFRDRQNSGTRQYRGNYNYDRKEHGDREGSWVNSKSRYGGRSRVRAQFDRHSSRVSQLSTSDDRADNTWETHNQEKLAYCQADTSSVSSVRSDHVSTDTARAMYPSSAVSNGINSSGPVGPPLIMFCSYDPSAGYGSPNEQAEFGSVGPVHSTDVNVVSNPWDRSGAGSMFEKRHGKYQHSSSRSSPERQSSPEVS